MYVCLLIRHAALGKTNDRIFYSNLVMVAPKQLRGFPSLKRDTPHTPSKMIKSDRISPLNNAITLVFKFQKVE